METLKTYLNSLTPDEQDAFAIKCGTSIGYMRKAITKNTKLGPILSVKIEQNSNGVVTRKDLHPDDWGQIWPELSLHNNAKVAA